MKIRASFGVDYVRVTNITVARIGNVLRFSMADEPGLHTIHMSQISEIVDDTPAQPTCKAWEQEIKGLQDQVADGKQAVKIMSSQVDAKQAELEMVQRNIAVLRVENDALKNERDGLRNDARTATDAKEKIEKDNEYYLKKIDSLNTLCQQRSAALEKLRSGQQPITQRFEITIKPV